MTTRVIAVDAGSVKKNFAWAGLDLPGREPIGEGGRHPEGAATAVLEAPGRGVPVALGFEAPLMVPVSPIGIADGWLTLGQARQGEAADGRSRPWSAGAGSGALATGIVQLAWVLERIGSADPASDARPTPSPGSPATPSCSCGRPSSPAPASPCPPESPSTPPTPPRPPTLSPSASRPPPWRTPM